MNKMIYHFRSNNGRNLERHTRLRVNLSSEQFRENKNCPRQNDLYRIWQPNNDGLGMAHCIDILNKLYTKKYNKFIDY
jgi:hypothetical protein